jgi:transcriptional regulator with XRE-family HTH domain
MPRTMIRDPSPAATLQLSNRETDRLRAKEFGRLLRNLMLKKRLKQSDLAMLAFGPTVDPKTGYTVAKGRDRICAYVNGRQFPEAKNLEAIAKALDVSEGDLTPEIDPQEMRRTASNYVIQPIPGRREQLFKIERVMDPLLINNIMALILAWDDLAGSKMQRRKSNLAPRQQENNCDEFNDEFVELAEKQKRELEQQLEYYLTNDLEDATVR